MKRNINIFIDSKLDYGLKIVNRPTKHQVDACLYISNEDFIEIKHLLNKEKSFNKDTYYVEEEIFVYFTLKFPLTYYL